MNMYTILQKIKKTNQSNKKPTTLQNRDLKEMKENYIKNPLHSRIEI